MLHIESYNAAVCAIHPRIERENALGMEGPVFGQFPSNYEVRRFAEDVVGTARKIWTSSF